MSHSKALRTGYLAISGVLFLLAIGNLFTAEDLPTTGPNGEEIKILPGEGTWIPTLTLIFLFVSLAYLIISYRKHYRVAANEEEDITSREFWMFIGSLVLSLSAIHITVQTSVNVGNIFMAPFESFFHSIHESTHWEWAKRMADHSFEAPGDKERFDLYHRIEIPLTSILFLIIAIGQFLKYKKTPIAEARKQIALSFFVALGLTLIIGFFTGFSESGFPIIFLLFASLFALVSNADYALRIIKGKLDHAGASVAHLGFAMLILGAIISTSQSFFISKNQIGNVTDLSKDFKNDEDLMILKGDTLAMGEYFIHYKDKYREGDHLYCAVEYYSQEPKTYQEGDIVHMQGMVFRANQTHTSSGDFLKDWSVDSLWSPQMIPSEANEHAPEWRGGEVGEYLFTLTPSVITSKKGNSREPSIKHFLGHDLYSFIKYTEVEESKVDTSGWDEAKSGIIQIGATMRMDEVVNFRLDSLVKVDTIPDNLPKNVTVKRGFVTLTNGKETENLVLASVLVNDSTPVPFPTESKKFKMLLSIAEKNGEVELTAQQKLGAKRDMLIMTAEVFPQINILWMGCLVMALGTGMAIRHRVKIRKKEQK